MGSNERVIGLSGSGCSTISSVPIGCKLDISVDPLL